MTNRKYIEGNWFTKRLTFENIVCAISFLFVLAVIAGCGTTQEDRYWADVTRGVEHTLNK